MESSQFLPYSFSVSLKLLKKKKKKKDKPVAPIALINLKASSDFLFFYLTNINYTSN